MKTKGVTRILLLHTLAWSTFILYETSVLFLTSSPKQTHWWTYIGYYVLNILLFYVHAHIVLAVTTRKRGLVVLLTALVPLELSCYILLEYGLEHFYNLFRLTPAPVRLDHKFIIGYIWRGIYFMGLSTAYWLVLRTSHNTKRIIDLKKQQMAAQVEKAQLEKNLIQTQNAYLQAQINPHLLFNTLNFIYNKVQDVSPEASEGIILLSEVMRHALATVHEDGKIDLQHEIEHIEKYIALNQLRFRYPLHLNLQLDKKFDAPYRIPPLILLTFIENMFNHGDLTDPELPASVFLSCRNQQLCFTAQNKKRKRYIKRGYGIGLQNVRTRLKGFYEKQDYCLQIQENEMNYGINLQIKLT